MISGNVFTAGGSLNLREALDTHQLLVSWKLIHPACMERVCIEFLGSSLDDHCISSPQSTMAVIEGLPCNINVRIRVKVLAVGFASRLLVGSVYIGGKLGVKMDIDIYSSFVLQATYIFSKVLKCMQIFTFPVR